MTTPLSHRIGFLGAGRMATALAGGFLKAGLVTADNLFAADISAEARDRFAKTTQGTICRSNVEVVRQSNVVFLSVKPHHVGELLREISSDVTDAQLLVSIAAGVPLKTIAEQLHASCRLVRVMPNTPCLIGAGASAFSPGRNATEDDAEIVHRLLSTIGLAVRVEESLLDAVTGLSGSGPAYGFQIIEALSDGGVRAGLPRHIATQLAAQTLMGAARMVLETGEHPAALKDAVASPGGTTIAGLQTLERHGLRAALMEAVCDAALRSAELGESS